MLKPRGRAATGQGENWFIPDRCENLSIDPALGRPLRFVTNELLYPTFCPGSDKLSRGFFYAAGHPCSASS